MKTPSTRHPARVRELLALLVLCGASAHAAGLDWEATYPAERVASYLPAAPVGILVAASGADVEALLARTAFSTALRDSRRTRLTLDASSLGDLAMLDDQEIVKRAAGQPVDWIAVVRAFPGEGRRYSAVITIYDPSGEAVLAISGERGRPIAFKRSAPVARTWADPVRAWPEPARAWPEPARVWIEPPVPVGTPAEQEFQRKVIDVTPLGASMGRGRLHVNLQPFDFYTTVGRADYAESFETRRRTRVALIAIGTVLAIGGLAVSIGAGFVDPSTGSPGSFLHPCNSGCKTMVGVGVPMMVLGVGVTVGGALYRTSPISHEADQRLARGYNGKLRRQLQLSAE